MDGGRASRLPSLDRCPPQAGDVIPGAGGRRRVRWSRAGTVQRSGARVIHYNPLADGRIHLLLIYAKGVQDNVALQVLLKIKEALDADDRKEIEAVDSKSPPLMLSAAAHFAAGTTGAVLIFLISVRWSGERNFSAPFGLVFIGVACAALSAYLGTWATPAVLGLYALAAIVEAIQARRSIKSQTPRQ